MDAAAGACAERKPPGDDEIDTDILIMRRCEARDRVDANALDAQVSIDDDMRMRFPGQDHCSLLGC
jgi:hypothetical protein